MYFVGTTIITMVLFTFMYLLPVAIPNSIHLSPTENMFLSIGSYLSIYILILSIILIYVRLKDNERPLETVDILLLVSILVILKIVLYVGDALDQIKGTKFVVERSFKNLKEDMGKEMEQVKNGMSTIENRTVSTVQSITVNVSSLRKLIVDLAMSNVEQRNIEIDRRVLKRMKDLGLEVCDVV